MERLVFGIQPVFEALRANRSIVKRILIEENSKNPALRQIQSLAEEKGITVQKVSRAVLSRMSKDEHHQGVVGGLTDQLYASWDDLIRNIRTKGKWARVLILDGLEDPQNFGSLIRTAEACGAAGIIIPKDRAVGLTPGALKASAGAFAHLPIVQVTNLANSLEDLKREGFWILGADARGEKSLYTMRWDMDIGVVIGGEGKGIRPRVLSKCDFVVSIPMVGKVSSLNAAIAGAIILFEIFRQHTCLAFAQ
jgi:23S rRNA (guanosine2251-2'-O)-methyltransferase